MGDLSLLRSNEYKMPLGKNFNNNIYKSVLTFEDSGGEIPGEPPLPTPVWWSRQREQDGLPKVASSEKL